jgi:tetratricopeptide (TPR) repeat protein
MATLLPNAISRYRHGGKNFSTERAKPFLHLLYSDWVFGLVLLAITLIAYRPAWNGSPLWDDEASITSPELRSPEGLLRIWTHLGATQQYYPLLHSVCWVEYRLWGDRTTGNHLFNILLHVFSALLLMNILRKLNVPGARLAAAIFALHPVMVESVAWITEMKNTLSGVFFLSATLGFLTYSEKRKRRWYFLAYGLFILGLLSKTAIAPFPLAMLAVLWWKQGRLFWRNDVAPLIPFFLAGVAFGLITSYVERTFVGAEGHDFSFSAIERCLIAGRAIWFYLSKVFWPADLMFIYPRWEVNTGVWWQYLFPAATLLAMGGLWAVRRRWRAPAAMFLYYTAMLLPVLGFFNVFAFRFSLVADHWQYCASIGPIAMAAALMGRALRLVKGNRRFLMPAVAVILLSVLGLLSWKQSGMYADAETLYRTIIKKNPACWMANNNLGIVLAQTDRIEEAIDHYRKALEFNPDYAPAHYNLGSALRQTGQTNEAIVHFQRALEIHPDNAKTHFNLGNALMQAGRSSEGIAQYRMALEINPLYAEACYTLGDALMQAGQSSEGIAQYQRALEISPGFSAVHFHLGRALMLAGQANEAIPQFQQALEVNPDDINVLNSLRTAYLQTGQLTEAILVVRKALEVARTTGKESLESAIEKDLKELCQGNSPSYGKIPSVSDHLLK